MLDSLLGRLVNFLVLLDFVCQVQVAVRGDLNECWVIVPLVVRDLVLVGVGIGAACLHILIEFGLLEIALELVVFLV